MYPKSFVFFIPQTRLLRLGGKYVSFILILISKGNLKKKKVVLIFLFLLIFLSTAIYMWKNSHLNICTGIGPGDNFALKIGFGIGLNCDPFKDVSILCYLICFL